MIDERIELEYRIGLALIFLAAWATLAATLAARPDLSWWQGILTAGLGLGCVIGVFLGTIWCIDKGAAAIAGWHLARKRRQETAP